MACSAPPLVPPARKPSYAAVLRAPHALRTFIPALAGRLSYGTVFTALTVALARSTGSYAWAGAAVALFGIGGSLLAPLRAGLIDRYGRRRPLRLMSAAYATLLALLAAATTRSSGASPFLLLPLTLLAGTCAPPLGPVMRSLWSDLLPEGPLRLRAFSLDTVCEELLYVAGPLIAGACIALGRPEAGVALSAVLVAAGTFVMTASPAMAAQRTVREHRSTQDDGDAPKDGDAPAPSSRSGTGRRPYGPVTVTAGLGLALGALDLLVVITADRHHNVAAVAWIQASLSLAARSAVSSTEPAPGGGRARYACLSSVCSSPWRCAPPAWPRASSPWRPEPRWPASAWHRR